MAIGERIHHFRLLRGFTQKYLGQQLGFSESQADVRIAQYEKGSRSPKQNLETSTVGKKLISLTKKNRLEDSQLPTDKTWHSIMTEEIGRAHV